MSKVKLFLVTVLVVILLLLTTDFNGKSLFMNKETQESTHSQSRIPESQVDVAVTTLKAPVNCDDLLDTHINSASLANERMNMVLDFFQTLPESMQNRNEQIDLMASLLDVPREKAFAHKSRYYKYRKADDDIYNGERELLEYNQTINVVNLIDNRKYDDIAALYSSGTISKFGHVFEESVLHTIFEQSPDIYPEELALVLQSGVAITLNDLVSATQFAQNTEKIALLIQYADIDVANIDLTKVWKSNFRSNSLSTTAIEAKSSNLLDFWLGQGSPVFSAAQNLNAYDHIVTPTSQDEENSTKEIVDLLLSSGLNQISFATYEKKIKPLGFDKSLFEITEPSFTEGEAELFSEISGKIKETDSAIAQALLLEKSCNIDLNQSNNTDTTTVKEPDEIYYSRPVLRERMLNQMRNVNEYVTNSEVPRVLKDIQNALMDEKTDWQNVLTLSDELIQNEEGAQFLDVLLTEAVRKYAPIETIQKLLAKGASPQEHLILVSVTQGYMTATTLLLNHGLDLHYVDQNGKNALGYSVQLYNARDMFSLLLNNNVAISPSGAKKDALDFALSSVGYVDFETELYYIETLLNHGAIIKPRHKDLLKELGSKFPKSYNRIMEIIDVDF